MNVSLPVLRSANLTRIFWHVLFYTVVCYGFHRYLFKYSHGAFAKEGYQQTPLIWQAGKFVLVAVMMGLIYLNSRFTARISTRLLLIYAFLAVVLIVNIGSIVLYQEVMTDELEYLIYATLLLPLAFVTRDDLQVLADEIDPILNVSQYIFIASNWIVIFNYFAFRIIPFHAYEGVLMRFGGLWDDPNTFAIFSVFLMGYAMLKKQYVLVTLHTINVLLTISLNGYLLLLAFGSYWLLNSSKNRILYVGLFSILLGFIAVLVFYNLDYAIQIYEAKQESIDQHSSIVNMAFYGIPLLQPIEFHETWFLSENVNYFPFSVPFTVAMIVIFIRFFLFRPRSMQRLLFIIFFITSLFLPFLYMFPVNFIALLFLVLYTKGVQF
ncbi:hypothetical protein HNV11_02415 [Spirosoma taeanense]|uniref:Uncharacterized protein n=1 Tax=Spirosoma taeanense TaxID=2735870 RepID=A0A6M5Y0K8_9BACT|nr:hypothetical protein [Spirosoma taeanense]QJW88307.1 hypothetical protein HNV11_02415 [Spirosoma taeanense]